MIPGNLLRRPLSRFARDTAWMTAANYAGLGVRFLATLALAYLLGKEGYGLWGILTGFLPFLGTLFTVRIHEVVVTLASQALARDDAPRAIRLIRVAFWVEGVVGVVVAVALLFLPGWLAHVPRYGEIMERNPAFSAWIQWFAVASLLEALTGPSYTVLQVLGRFRAFAAVNLAGAIGRGLLPLGCYLIRPTLGSAVAGYLLAEAFSAVVSAAAAWRAHRARFRGIRAPGWGGVGAEVRPLAMHTTLSSSLKAVNAQADVPVLGGIAGANAVGLYKMASTLAGIVEALSSGAVSVILPELSRLWANGERARYRRLLFKYGAFMFGLSAVAGAAVAGGASILLPWWKGGEYLGSVALVWILVAAKTLTNGFFWVRPFSLSIRRPDYSTWMNGIAAVSMMAGMGYLAPRYGALGMAWTVLITAGLVVAGWTFFLGRFWRQTAEEAGV